jgi:AcrR family transcriptional regulator
VARPTLAPEEVERFRQRLCEVALRRFAEDGYDAVTLRGLASELGCSYATPYRYFRDKQEIFSAVRGLAYERFALALEAAAAGSSEPPERLRQLMRSYLRFALEQPEAYRLMFELHQPALDAQSQYRPKELRAWEIWSAEILGAIQAGALDGDPSTVAHLLWAGVHGVAALHLAGKLVLGRDIDALATPMIEALLSSQSPPHRRAPGVESG